MDIKYTETPFILQCFAGDHDEYVRETRISRLSTLVGSVDDGNDPNLTGLGAAKELSAPVLVVSVDVADDSLHGMTNDFVALDVGELEKGLVHVDNRERRRRLTHDTCLVAELECL